MFVTPNRKVCLCGGPALGVSARQERGKPMRMMLLSLLMSPALAAGAEVRPLAVGAAVEDFTLRDHRGAERPLCDWRDRPFVVVAFLGVDCPLAKLYGRRLGEIEREFAPQVAVL